jgi:hypothetical protein
VTEISQRIKGRISIFTNVTTTRIKITIINIPINKSIKKNKKKIIIIIITITEKENGKTSSSTRP